jgi:hypothetical protein
MHDRVTVPLLERLQAAVDSPCDEREPQEQKK